MNVKVWVWFTDQTPSIVRAGSFVDTWSCWRTLCTCKNQYVTNWITTDFIWFVRPHFAFFFWIQRIGVQVFCQRVVDLVLTSRPLWFERRRKEVTSGSNLLKPTYQISPITEQTATEMKYPSMATSQTSPPALHWSARTLVLHEYKMLKTRTVENLISIKICKNFRWYCQPHSLFCSLHNAILVSKPVRDRKYNSYRPVSSQVVQSVQQRHVRSSDTWIRNLSNECHHRNEHAVGGKLEMMNRVTAYSKNQLPDGRCIQWSKQSKLSTQKIHRQVWSGESTKQEQQTLRQWRFCTGRREGRCWEDVVLQSIFLSSTAARSAWAWGTLQYWRDDPSEFPCR